MSHQLLLHLHGSACLVQPRTVGVAERMPPDAVRQADEFGNPVELMLLEAFLVEGLSGLRIGENQSASLEYALKVRYSNSSPSRRGSSGT